MIEKKYGKQVESSKDARILSALYSADGANTLTIAICDMHGLHNAKGVKGTTKRRRRFENADDTTKQMYEKTGTIGTEWIILECAISTFFRMPIADLKEMFDSNARFKATTKAYRILDKMIASGKIRIIYRGNDYVKDLFVYWEKASYNFGYAFELFYMGFMNKDAKARQDGMKRQLKTSFTLYRTEKEEKADKSGFYDVGTGKGVSTGNGFR